MNIIKRGFIFSQNIIASFLREGCPLQAAGLSYVSLLSLVPLMTVSLSILAIFPKFRGIGDQVQQFILSNFIASSAQVVQHHLQEFIHQAMRLSVPGILFLLITSILMVFSLEQAFNHIWKVDKRRNFVQAFLMYWAVITLIPILISAGIVITTPVVTKAAMTLPALKTIAIFVFPYLFTFLAFMFLYMAVPNCKVRFRDAARGAVVATILFDLVKLGFAFYIIHFPTYKLIYGALAAVPLFLLWLYLSWIVILFGGLISYAISK